MMKKSVILVVVCLCSLLQAVAKDDYSYRNITMNDGLTSTAVRNIVQDRYGYLWFGTDNGLCRYDGTKVQPHKIAALGVNQYVSALMAGEQGIYAGTEHGVFCFSFERTHTEPAERTTFEQLPLDIHSAVTHISLDKDNQLWVSTMGDGVWRYALKTGQVRQYDVGGSPVAQVFVDNSNQVWTVTNWSSQAVCRLNRLHDKFEPVNLSFDSHYGSLCMLQTHDGQLWLGTWENGLLLMHSDGRLEQVLSPAITKVGLHIHTLFERLRTGESAGMMQQAGAETSEMLGDDVICIGCDDGLIYFNPKTKQWKRGLAQQGLADRFVYSITTDTEGGLWVGTFYGGVTYVSPVGRRFDGLSVETGLNGNVVSRFCEDRQGRIWIASDDGGLMCYSPVSRQFVAYPHRDMLGSLNVHALAMKGEELWIGTYTTGVYVLDLSTGRLRHYFPDNTEGCLDDFSSYAIYHDHSGRVWVATRTGLHLFNPSTDNFTLVDKLEATTIDIDEDREGRLWLATQGGGLLCYAQTTCHKTSLPDNQVNCIHIDYSGRLWVGTASGLYSTDKDNDDFDRVPLDMPSCNVMGIVEEQGVLWLSTERGIIRYEPNSTLHPQTTRFTLHDGLLSEQFQPNAAMKASDGRIYFGSNNGLNFFYPYQIKANSVMPPVYITSLEVNGHELLTDDGATLDLTLTDEMKLDYHDARMLSFSFASLSFCSPQKNQYAYMMEGFDNDWNLIGNQHKATYTNLPAGVYTFRVRATNNDGVWSDHEAQLRLRVHPPFWWSWWAQLFYLLLAVAAVWYYIHYRLQRANQLHQQEMQRLAQQKENEVREARLNFFTMIAHEIRTPVSLIIGPLEQIKKEIEANHSPSTLHHSSLQVIDRNAHRLLELVNQLLDFRKIEQQQVVIHFAPQNVCQLIQNVCERFAPTFEQGGKHFTVDYPDPHFTAILDKEAVTKVVSNLLTNANKYSKDEVRLSCLVTPGDNHFAIIVSDNGIGIREEDRQRIFEPFYQAQDNKPGTGIGLNIVKNIVDLHHGTITVESEVGRGSTFKVELPVNQTNLGLEDQTDTLEVKSPVASQTSALKPPLDQWSLATSGTQETSNLKPPMLIVDDNQDMVSFLKDNFSGRYEVLVAFDGIEALELLSRNEVSIIISDWMMPRMDGVELCRQVRRNAHTSHIPFIMLTAKTDDVSKVKGVSVGADIYIEKPFSLEYVEACINQVIQMRRQLMQKFSTQPWQPVTEIATTPVDNQFLVKLNALIEENMANSDLNVNFLAEKLNISRSGLFAKIKSLTDVTPNEMIQVVRLKRAAQLLLQGNYLISEVGYMVGFSSSSYFSKCFFKQFGKKPADFVKEHGETTK